MNVRTKASPLVKVEKRKVQAEVTADSQFLKMPVS